MKPSIRMALMFRVVREDDGSRTTALMRVRETRVPVFRAMGWTRLIGDSDMDALILEQTYWRDTLRHR